MPLQKKRKHHPPAPSLGVLEFASALNGDDAILIIQKLHQFVKIVQHERFVALSSTSEAGIIVEDGKEEEDDGMQEDDETAENNSDTDSSIL